MAISLCLIPMGFIGLASLTGGVYGYQANRSTLSGPSVIWETMDATS